MNQDRYHSPNNNPQPNPHNQPIQQPGPQPYPQNQPYQQQQYPPQNQQQTPQQGYPQPAYPQQPYGQQPPPYGYQGYSPYNPPPKKSGIGWLTCLIIAVVMGCICVCLTGIILFAAGKISIGFLEPYLDDLQTIIPGLNLPNGVSQVLSNTNSVTVTSGQGGTLSAPGGAMVSIPPAAVPKMEDGSEGTMVFTLQEDNDTVPQMPQGYSSAGPIYRLGPEGFTFTVPVTITLPIPADTNLEGVLGLSYLDTATNTWVLVPGTVDATNRTVSAAVTHFSPWTVFGSCLNTFGACDSYNSVANWKNENFGTIRVNNSHLYETGSYPEADGKGLPIGVSYGVCIDTYTLTDPSVEYAWDKPYDWKMVVSDYYFPGGAKQVHPPMEWNLPAGQYAMVEVLSISEVNHSPGYSPAFTNYWRPAGTLSVSPGQEFEYSVSTVDSVYVASWTKGRPNCYGIEDTSVGTGDVQVTLTWQTNDDIDLYVTDPDGYVIYYNDMMAPSGGQLDRDNLCGEMVIGRPENIFWPSGGAPSGTYQVAVNYYGACESVRSVNWTVRIVRMGITETFTGTLTSSDETQQVTTFTIP